MALHPREGEIVVVAVHAKSWDRPRDRELREATFAALESAYDDVATRVGGEVLFIGDFNTDGYPDTSAARAIPFPGSHPAPQCYVAR